MEGLANLFASHVCKYDKNELVKRTNDNPLVTLEVLQKYEKDLTQQAKFYELEYSKDDYTAFRQDIGDLADQYNVFGNRQVLRQMLYQRAPLYRPYQH